MLHVTGLDGVSSKVMNDSFGTGTYSVFVGRGGRGTANSPSPSQSGDTLARFSGSSYAGSNTSFISTGVGRMDIITLENASDTNRGAMISFSATPIGSNVITIGLMTIASNMVTIGANTQLNVANNLVVTGSATVGGNTVATQVVGTWTPSFAFTTQGAQTYTTQIGNYVKTGRSVFATFAITTSADSGSGNLSINLTGLPTPLTATGDEGGMTVTFQSVAGNIIGITGRITSGATSVPVYGAVITIGGGGAGTVTYRQLTETDLGATATLTGTIQYISAN